MNGFVQLTDNKEIFEFNKLSLPSLVQIDSLNEIDSSWDFFFFLDKDEIVHDKYRVDKLCRVEDDISWLIRSSEKLKKDAVYVPVSTINYKPFPPKILSNNMMPRIFRTSKFKPETLTAPIDKRDKKVYYQTILFYIYVQVVSNVEIGNVTHGIMPKLLGA